MSKPHVVIIGAGFTGIATAHDLALRGFDVTVIDRGDICNGTSGRTHGLLHSGGRYAVKDQESAIECIDENMILRKIVPDVIEPNGGLFIAIDEGDLQYGECFIAGCEACHIPLEEFTPQEALKLEPNINPNLDGASSFPMEPLIRCDCAFVCGLCQGQWRKVQNFYRSQGAHYGWQRRCQ